MTIFKPNETKLPKYSKLDHVEIWPHLNGRRYVITEIWHDDEREYYYDLNEWPLETHPEPIYNAHEKALRQIKDKIWENDQLLEMSMKVRKIEKRA